MTEKSRPRLFERLKAGLQEGIEHARGLRTLKTTVLPEPPPEIDARTLVALREGARMSQAVFAMVLSVSAKTVQGWEQGVRVPSQASRRLIHLFAEQPGMVCRVVGLEPVEVPGFTIRPAGKGKRRIVREPAAGGR